MYFVLGYAWSGGGRGVVRVDVTVDKGETWHVADINGRAGDSEPGKEWSWVLWSANVPVASDCNEVSLEC